MRVVSRFPETDGAKILVDTSCLRIARGRLSWDIDGGINFSRVFSAARQIRSFVPLIGRPEDPILAKLAFDHKIPGGQQGKSKVLLENGANIGGECEGDFWSR